MQLIELLPQGSRRLGVASPAPAGQQIADLAGLRDPRIEGQRPQWTDAQVLGGAVGGDIGDGRSGQDVLDGDPAEALSDVALA